MKKVLLGLAAAAVLILAGLVAVIWMQPDVLHVERSRTMPVAPADVLAVAGDMTRAQAWSPWAELDPAMVITRSDAPTGVGAWYGWNGNDAVGEGRLTVTRVDGTSVVSRLQFVRPFESEAETAVTAVPEGAGSRVTWSYTEKAGFVSKAFGLVVDMDGMLGSDFEKGLALLEPLALARAAERTAAVAPDASPAEDVAATGTPSWTR